MTASKIITAHEARKLEAVSKREELNNYEVKFEHNEKSDVYSLAVGKKLENGFRRQFAFIYCYNTVISWIIEDHKWTDGKKEKGWGEYDVLEPNKNLPTEDELVELITGLMNH